jgi:hypothetical protein
MPIKGASLLVRYRQDANFIRLYGIHQGIGKLRKGLASDAISNHGRRLRKTGDNVDDAFYLIDKCRAQSRAFDVVEIGGLADLGFRRFVDCG